ncbi:nucleotide sugar dehydrogenase [Natronosporangium hydrolyticum]|uniref:Nucleotide sugar dehydrogenase n=1 Tax=Natronosporangium hydrolyticum TaxID=2811111 RepID=A0A895YTX6_9ACTN|nr:nucleotide sugar dehydrogenase [Natronosporangium hydrolyticum]
MGGCGRAGLPLGLAFAARGMTVTLYDINAEAVAKVNAAQLPFAEAHAGPLLTEAVEHGRLWATTDDASVGDAEQVIVVIGTPVDEHLNPDLDAVPQALSRCLAHLRDGQLLVLRSTVHPGVTALTEQLLTRHGLRLDVAFCPERIAEGRALTELFSLPQLVAARTATAADRAEKLFRHLTEQIVRLTPEEAELAKLFTNTWRYIKFATANQFWMMANDAGLDYQRIQHAITFEYPRAADVPLPGFAAGPCLLKDTLQLAAFHQNNFVLGHAAMLINEGLPLYLVNRLAARYDLPRLTVGLLGTAFKGGSDDPRESLAYKLRKLLTVRARAVICTDPYVVDDRLVPLPQVLAEADLLVLGSPHPEYAQLATELPIVDIWGLTRRGVRV